MILGKLLRAVLALETTGAARAATLQQLGRLAVRQGRYASIIIPTYIYIYTSVNTYTHTLSLLRNITCDVILYVLCIIYT